MNIQIDISNVLSENIGNEHGLNFDVLEQFCKNSQPLYENIKQKIADESIGFFNLPKDKEIIEEIKSYTDSVKNRYEYYVHVGIGGSALGPITLQNSLNSNYYNLSQKPKMFFPDNVDPDWLEELFENIVAEKTLFHIVSKSGSTAETAATFLKIMDYLDKALGKNYYKNLLFTTDPHKGLLNQIALENPIKCFRIPDNVGGRFSVLTPVGLVSAALTGINIEKLMLGADKMAEKCLNPNLIENPAFVFAAIHTYYMDHGKNISVMMPYSNKLKDVSDWYCQLWAESLGKQVNNNGETIHTGQTPVKALGATDQHSQIQLYKEGPNDKVISFIEVESFKNNLVLKNHFSYIEDFNYFEGKSLGQLLNSEKKATELALTSSNRPNLTVKLSQVNPENVGGLIMLLQVATAFAGEILNINAFNQPGVEEGKIATYALMGRKGYEKKRQEIEQSFKNKNLKVIK